MLYLVSLPNPVHGMSLINHYVVRDYSEKDDSVINLVPSWAAQLFPGVYWQLVKAFWQLYCLARFFVALFVVRPKTVYFSISGGRGQIFDILFALIGWPLRSRFIVHHHSYAYVRKPTRASKVLLWLLRRSTHVVLAREMVGGIENHGVPRSNIMVYSNTVFMNFEYDAARFNRRVSDTVNCLYLSNITEEKGVLDYIEAVEILAATRIVNAKIAGPISCDVLKSKILAATERLPYLDWVGPLYGEAKSEAFEAADVFLFPSKYENEAEPLVVYEAARAGCFIVTSAVGCLPSVVKALNGRSVKNGCPADYAAAVESLISSGSIGSEKIRLAVEQLVDERASKRKMFKSLLMGSS